MWGLIILGIYLFALIYITIYCLLQVNLLLFYKKGKRNGKQTPIKKLSLDDDLPFVTIQLPIYNEMYVVERLIDNIVQQNYPKDKFEIHVLDDSTDETVEITKLKVEEYQAKGFNIEQITRVNRVGYKAGALKEATPKAKGDLIAIFDADFLPRPDFLLTTVSYFDNPKIGVVQTRWEHINKEYSILTRLQAMHLDVHFTVEQSGRKLGNCLLQFNGTAGVWRKQCIDDAGGWEADTLTEDLDLSYRAQIKGWEIIYLERFGSPAELPAEMNGLKSQQFRWMKGGAETARKMLPVIWKSDALTLRQKVHGTVHLMASGVFIFILIAAITSVPAMFVVNNLGLNINASAIFLVSLIAIIFVFYEANVRATLEQSSRFRLAMKFIVYFPLFLALSMGLSLHNTIAVVQGYLGKKSAFIRTPKFNINQIGDSFKSKSYFTGKLKFQTVMEGLLAIYFLLAFIKGISLNTGFVVFHGLLTLGFGFIFFYSIRHLRFKG